MKAISIREPFASLIANGHKTIETRTWSTKYRGPVLICVSKAFVDKVVIEDHLPEHAYQYDVLHNNFKQNIGAYQGEPFKIFPGHAIAVVDLVDSRPLTLLDNSDAWTNYENTDGIYSHVYENIRLIEPMQMKGKLGYWNLTEKEIQKIKYL